MITLVIMIFGDGSGNSDIDIGAGGGSECPSYFSVVIIPLPEHRTEE